MKIGVLKEVNKGEYRVAISPENVQRLVRKGHAVLVQSGAGARSGMTDEAYAAAGASIAPDSGELYREAEMLLKVKELSPSEYVQLSDRQILFAYIHSAIRPELTQALLDKRIVGFACEDIRQENGQFPLLTPMSEIAGEVGMIMGIYHSMTTNGGAGLLIGGAPGVEPAKIVVLGAGHAGLGAARYAHALGADVTIVDVNLDRLRDIRSRILPSIKTLYSSDTNIRRLLPETDILVNAVKWVPGVTLVSRSMLSLMKDNALIIDVDCEPGGAIETCAFTTHEDPIFAVDGIRHFCVPNLPSAVARTASYAFTNATIPYIEQIADKGWERAARENAALRSGLDFALGHLLFETTASFQNRPYITAEQLFERLDRERTS